MPGETATRVQMIQRILDWFRSQARAEAVQRSPIWPFVREEHLKREQFCRACGTQKSLIVHHCLPISWPGGSELELDRGNLITLCDPPGGGCHLFVGHLKNFQSYNPNVREDAATWLLKIRQRPVRN